MDQYRICSVLLVLACSAGKSERFLSLPWSERDSKDKTEWLPQRYYYYAQSDLDNPAFFNPEPLISDSVL